MESDFKMLNMPKILVTLLTLIPVSFFKYVSYEVYVCKTVIPYTELKCREVTQNPQIFVKISYFVSI